MAGEDTFLQLWTGIAITQFASATYLSYWINNCTKIQQSLQWCKCCFFNCTEYWCAAILKQIKKSAKYTLEVKRFDMLNWKTLHFKKKKMSLKQGKRRESAACSLTNQITKSKKYDCNRPTKKRRQGENSNWLRDSTLFLASLFAPYLTSTFTQSAEFASAAKWSAVAEFLDANIGGHRHERIGQI